MANPIRYTQANKITHSRVQYLLDEFEEELIHMSGKCMDIGCGPGDLTRYILLPTLDPKAVVIGKKVIHCKNITHVNEDYSLFALYVKVLTSRRT